MGSQRRILVVKPCTPTYIPRQHFKIAQLPIDSSASALSLQVVNRERRRIVPIYLDQHVTGCYPFSTHSFTPAALYSRTISQKNGPVCQLTPESYNKDVSLFTLFAWAYFMVKFMIK